MVATVTAAIENQPKGGLPSPPHRRLARCPPPNATGVSDHRLGVAAGDPRKTMQPKHRRCRKIIRNAFDVGMMRPRQPGVACGDAEAGVAVAVGDGATRAHHQCTKRPLSPLFPGHGELNSRGVQLYAGTTIGRSPLANAAWFRRRRCPRSWSCGGIRSTFLDRKCRTRGLGKRDRRCTRRYRACSEGA